MSTVQELNIENRSGEEASPVATVGPCLQGFPDQTSDGGCLQQTPFFFVSEYRLRLSVLGLFFSVPGIV